MNVILPKRMTVDEFLAWSRQQDSGRYELEDGSVVVQQAQNIGHLRVKARVYEVLSKAIAAVDIPFYVLPDGATVRVDERTAYEPDALVAPLPMPDDAALEVPDPLIIVEVLSPSSERRDLVQKVAGYFRLSSVRHYLVVDPVAREIVWHRRAAGGGLEVPVVAREGVLRLDPPGIEVEVAKVLE